VTADALSYRRIRSSEDTSAAEDLLIRFFREEGFDTPAQTIRANCRKLAEQEICALFLAEIGYSPVGVATISLNFGVEFGWLGEMGDLYVLPEFRNRGVARGLVFEVEKFLSSRGASGYQVTVTPYARRAHALQHFYAKLGFGNEGREILYKRLR
jgi:GNAT superfamily N-acetyltransferase